MNPTDFKEGGEYRTRDGAKATIQQFESHGGWIGYVEGRERRVAWTADGRRWFPVQPDEEHEHDLVAPW